MRRSARSVWKAIRCLRRSGAPTDPEDLAADDGEEAVARRKGVFLHCAADSAIRQAGGWPVPTADPFDVMTEALAFGLDDITYADALEALQTRLAQHGYPPFRPPLGWTVPGL
ncbi:hypothetical protein [Yinghuangia seranimata]|uniref:hypothetical protein n=1 Tax=Yinghuangia seranimata TaxID=408067 RepID=UPI00248BF7DF|nr:hypothetical protein [Yinghuangia seranimata]MDI2128393.1 hypothetical protein [Yinghuangia seranimata]